jgi:dTMP kinase
MKGKKGIFITLEGVEGAGKSTHLSYIAKQLQQAGREVVITREPGGTPLGERIREILLMHKSVAIDGMSELLLMLAARAQHIRDVITPALHNGNTVLCDRFMDSSYAYQGAGRGIPADTITQLSRAACDGLKPDLTLLFDVPVVTGLQRACRDREADRFERESFDFFQAVREAYLKIAKSDPARVKVINTDVNINVVHARIREILQEQGLC